MCDRCLGLGYVPARHPLADPETADVMPCPDCRTREAIASLRRRPSSLRHRLHADEPIHLGGALIDMNGFPRLTEP